MMEVSTAGCLRAVLEELEKPTGVPTPCHAVPLVCLPDGNTKPLCVRYMKGLEHEQHRCAHQASPRQHNSLAVPIDRSIDRFSDPLSVCLPACLCTRSPTQALPLAPRGLRGPAAL